MRDEMITAIVVVIFHRATHVYRFIVRGTVESRMYSLLQSKPTGCVRYQVFTAPLSPGNRKLNICTPTLTTGFAITGY